MSREEESEQKEVNNKYSLHGISLCGLLSVMVCINSVALKWSVPKVVRLWRPWLTCCQEAGVS